LAAPLRPANDIRQADLNDGAGAPTDNLRPLCEGAAKKDCSRPFWVTFRQRLV